MKELYNDRDIKYSSQIRFMFFLMGIDATFNALIITTKITGQIAVLNYIILIVLIFQLFYRSFHINIYRYKNILVILFCIFVISSMFACYHFGFSWAGDSLKRSVKYMVMILPIIFLFRDKELIYYRKYFFKGLKISCYIQFIWEILEISLWKFKQISINEIVFVNILKVNTDHAFTFLVNGQLRPSGISWEPANLGMALALGFILSESILGKIIFSLGIFLSTSRTSVILWGMCVVYYLIMYVRRKHKSKSGKIKIKIRDVIIVISLLIIAIVAIGYINKSSINDIINNTIGRLINATGESASSAEAHSNYYVEMFSIIKRQPIINSLIGWGTGIAGYPYTLYFGTYSWFTTAWTPESDFISILFGNGILGFIAFYWFYLKNIRFNMKNNKNCLVLLCIMLGGILYIYFIGTWVLLVSIMLFIKIDENGEINENASDIYNYNKL